MSFYTITQEMTWVEDVLADFDESAVWPREERKPLGCAMDTTYAQVAMRWHRLGFYVIPGGRDKRPWATFCRYCGPDGVHGSVDTGPQSVDTNSECPPIGGHDPQGVHQMGVHIVTSCCASCDLSCCDLAAKGCAAGIPGTASGLSAPEQPSTGRASRGGRAALSGSTALSDGPAPVRRNTP